MTELSDHYMRVRDYAQKFSLDESTVYKMIERGEIKAIRIGKKTLRIPSSELERYLEREPTSDREAGPVEERVKAFRRANGRDPGPFVDAWRSGEIKDTPENAEVAIEALALRTALARQRVAAA
ncbi:MAG: helix-turn-helix domain-containing protein [Solirubrobacterales bacterium]